jgi:hypothetical protein
MAPYLVGHDIVTPPRHDMVAMRSAGETLEFAHDLQVGAKQECGMRISQFFWFLRLSEFLRLFRHTPVSLGLKIEIVRDETSSTNLDGIVVPVTDGEPLHKYRVMELWSGSCRFLREKVLDEQLQLRDKEPRETYNRINQVTNSKRNPDR